MVARWYAGLRRSGSQVIQDMSRDASHADIDNEMRRMELGSFSAFMTRATLEMLRRHAYSPAQFERLASESPFRTCEVQAEGIGLEVLLAKQHLA